MEQAGQLLGGKASGRKRSGPSPGRFRRGGATACLVRAAEGDLVEWSVMGGGHSDAPIAWRAILGAEKRNEGGEEGGGARSVGQRQPSGGRGEGKWGKREEEWGKGKDAERD